MARGIRWEKKRNERIVVSLCKRREVLGAPQNDFCKNSWVCHTEKRSDAWVVFEVQHGGHLSDSTGSMSAEVKVVLCWHALLLLTLGPFAL